MAASDFKTSLEEDEEWLERNRVPPGAAVWAAKEGSASGGKTGGAGASVGERGSGMDPRLPDVVEYRVQRKRLWNLAREILEAHEARFRSGE